MARRVLVGVLFLCLALGALPAIAAAQTARTWQVRFVWDPNTETDLAGYRLYQGNELLGPAIPAGTETATREIGAGDHVFSLTAIDLSGNESGKSAPVTLSLDEIPPGVPKAFTVEVVVDLRVTVGQ